MSENFEDKWDASDESEEKPFGEFDDLSLNQDTELSALATFDEVMSSGAKVGGSASVIFVARHPITGGVSGNGESIPFVFILPEGGISVGGGFEGNLIANEPNGVSSGLKAAGSANSGMLKFLEFQHSGGVESGGSLNAALSEVNFKNRGGVSVSGTSMRVDYSPVISLDLLWKSDAFVSKNLDLFWNVGQMPMYSYRIVSKGKHDPCLPQEECCERFVININARSLPDLCSKLSARRHKISIETVHRFGRPTYKYNAPDDDCNPLELIEVCHIPECAEFCVDEEVAEKLIFGMSVQENAFFEFENEGGVVSYGAMVYQPTFNIVEHEFTNSGGVSFSGSITEESNFVVGDGGATMGGSAFVTSSNYDFYSGVYPLTSGSKHANQASSVSKSVATPAWVYPENVNNQEELYSIVDVSFRRTSQLLVVNDFNIDLPENAVIEKIKVGINRLASKSGVRDHEVVLVNNNEPISRNLAFVDSDWPFIATTRFYGDTIQWYDEDDNVFYESITPSQIKSKQFGVVLSVRSSNQTSGVIGRVREVFLEVQYAFEDSTYIKIFGSSRIESSASAFANSGSVKVRGVFENIPSKIYNTIIKSSGLVAGGGSSFIYDEEGVGGLIAGGEGVAKPYHEIGSGGMVVSGVAEVTPYLEISDGGASLSGSASSQFFTTYIPSVGGPTIFGSIPAYIDSFSMKMSGGVSAIGTIQSENLDLFHTFSGGVTASGEQVVIFADDEIEERILFAMEVVEEGAVFLDDIDKGDLTTELKFVNRCDCFTIPEQISLSHNIAKDNIFAKFLVRNNLKMPTLLRLKYNSINNSWQSNLHYRGSSINGSAIEVWNMVSEMKCDQKTYGENIWKFSMYLSRKNLMTFEDSDTRISVTLTPSLVCDNFNSGLNFRISCQTQEGYATINDSIAVYDNLIYDNIGLFKNRAWIESPNLIFNITDTFASGKTNKVDLTEFVFR